MKNNINIELTNEEALVLFDFLGRFNEIDSNPLFQDQAEQRVFWDLECILEKQLVQPFDKNYKKLVVEACENVRDKE